MMSQIITVEVSLEEFDTKALVKELYYRVYDHLHDEEPRFDRFLERAGEYEKDSLRQALEEIRNHRNNNVVRLHDND